MLRTPRDPRRSFRLPVSRGWFGAFLLLAACGTAPESRTTAASAERAAARPVPAPGELNPTILAVAATYPTDGTHDYHWPRSGSWPGTTRDLHYDGALYAAGDPQGRCFCCGLTFEVFLLAWEEWADGDPARWPIPGIPDREALKRFQDHWFGSNGDRTTCLGALVSRDLGVPVEDPRDARPGDFVQFWRYRGSGHQVVFAGWETDREGHRTGLRYWSTQGATDGIGFRTEPIGEAVPDGRGIDAQQIHIVRVGRPHPTSPRQDGDGTRPEEDRSRPAGGSPAR